MGLRKKLGGFYPSIYLFLEIFKNRVPGLKSSVDEIYKKYTLNGANNTLSVDLGCGFEPRNPFKAKSLIGVDIYESEETPILKVILGFERLPFDDNSVDRITAFDVLEHIPRVGLSPDSNNSPFIFLMNEIHRVLAKGGIFYSSTPIYPYPAAFSDPTHVNIFTADTMRNYFSMSKYPIAEHYGIHCNFEVKDEWISKQHYLCVLKK